MTQQWSTLIALATLTAVAVLALSCGGSKTGSPIAPTARAAQNPVVVMDTSMGSMTIELFQAEAPITVNNFLQYAREGFYEGTIFHRVIQGFMIQGGGFTEDMRQKPTRDPIKNEADNGVSNERGTIAMARTGLVDSATAQFFINHQNNAGSLDHKGPGLAFGYAVFGRVTEGLDVLDAIAGVSTRPKGGHGDVPVDTVTINSVTVQ